MGKERNECTVKCKIVNKREDALTLETAKNVYNAAACYWWQEDDQLVHMSRRRNDPNLDVEDTSRSMTNRLARLLMDIRMHHDFAYELLGFDDTYRAYYHELLPLNEYLLGRSQDIDLSPLYDEWNRQIKECGELRIKRDQIKEKMKYLDTTRRPLWEVDSRRLQAQYDRLGESMKNFQISRIRINSDLFAQAAKTLNIQSYDRKSNTEGVPSADEESDE